MPYRNISEFLIVNSQRFPDKTAIFYKDKRISYRELNQRVNKIAQGLINLGITHGDKIAYLLPNSNHLIEVYFAIQKIGATAVPLNFRLIPSEIEKLLNNSKCKCLIFSELYSEKVYQIKGKLKTVSILISTGSKQGMVYSLEELISDNLAKEPPLFVEENAISRIQYTGGTTGLPKGVMRTHRNDVAEIISVMMSSKMGANPDEVVLIQCPLEHHGGHSWFVSCIGTGATLIICDTFDQDRILSLIEKEKVTYILLLPPTTHIRLLNAPNFSSYDLGSVKLVQSSAGATTPEIIKRLYEGYPNCQVNYGWGQTESGTGTSLVLTKEMAEKELPEVFSIGKPMPFLEMKIIDDFGIEVPVGKVGECIVRGPTTMVGYYDLPEENSKVLLPGGWIRTGDLMKKDENGYYYLLSRKKDLIKSGGENVYAKEVADVIRRHSAVEECIVFGVPDQKFGEAVMTVIQIKEGHHLTLEEIQKHCKKSLSSYKKPLHLDVIKEFPMDPAGKIATYKLVKTYKERFTDIVNVGQDGWMY